MSDTHSSPDFEPVPPPHPTQPEVDLLVNHCRTLPPLTILTYQEIEQITGVPHKSDRGRTITQRTLKKLVNDHELAFITRRKVGIQRVANKGIIEHAQKAVPGVRRKVVRTRKFMKCAQLNEMTSEEKTQFFLTSSTLGVLLSITAPKWLGQLEIKCLDAANQIPSRKVVELFLKTKSGDEG